MQIRNLRSTAREIAATGQRVEPGGTVDVDDALGAALCEQPDTWAPVPVPKSGAAGKSKED